MKKLLGIMVLGLLWCSISNAQHELNQTKETGGLGYWLVAGFLLLFVGFLYGSFGKGNNPQTSRNLRPEATAWHWNNGPQIIQI